MTIPDWMNVSPQSGTGGGEVEVRVENNRSYEERSGSFVVQTTSGITKGVQVSQSIPEDNWIFDEDSYIDDYYDPVTGAGITINIFAKPGTSPTDLMWVNHSQITSKYPKSQLEVFCHDYDMRDNYYVLGQYTPIEISVFEVNSFQATFTFRVDDSDGYSLGEKSVQVIFRQS